LLGFAVENFGKQSFADYITDNPKLEADYQAYLQDQQDQAFTINQTI